MTMPTTTKINTNAAANCATPCAPNDTTAPPRPQVRMAIATAGLLPSNTQFTGGGSTNVSNARDPAYIEIGDYEPGTRFQLLNISDNPKASFDEECDVIELEPTGRDVAARTAAIYIKAPEMKKLKLTAGHHLRMRAVDAAGNVSESVRLRLEGSQYGTRGRAWEKSAWVPASRGLTLLDGESSRKPFILKHMPDRVGPQTRFFEQDVTLKKNSKGEIMVSSDGTLEPTATVRITNGRTGTVKNAAVSAEQGFKMSLGKDVKDGDILVVQVNDAAGNAAKPIELRYGAKCKDGRASSLGVIAARLPGVL
jgi:hypothetical protein